MVVLAQSVGVFVVAARFAVAPFLQVDLEKTSLVQIPDIFPLTLFLFKVLNCAAKKQKLFLFTVISFLPGEVEEARTELGERREEESRKEISGWPPL